MNNDIVVKKKVKKVLITQSNYIPWKGYFDAINQVDEIILYDDMQYTKRDWRNRNQIKSPQGLLWLSIPVDVKGKYLQKINETLISEPGWNSKHWKTIVSNYTKAPYFKEYKDFFEELYLGSSEENLSKINYRFLKGISDLLGITTQFRWSSEFEIIGGKSEKLLNLCIQTGATSYYSGPAAKDYLDKDLFAQNNIEITWLDYSGYKEYPQLYGPFVHSVSIIDLIFNTGPEMKNYLKSF